MSLDARYLLSGGEDGLLVKWDIISEQVISSVTVTKDSSPIWWVHVLPRPAYLFTPGYPGLADITVFPPSKINSAQGGLSRVPSIINLMKNSFVEQRNEGNSQTFGFNESQDSSEVDQLKKEIASLKTSNLQLQSYFNQAKQMNLEMYHQLIAENDQIGK